MAPAAPISTGSGTIRCEAQALVVQDELLGVVESVRAELPIPATNFRVTSGCTASIIRQTRVRMPVGLLLIL